MEDNLIIQLFHERNETALSELSRKYGRHFVAIAERILCNHEDAKDCVNDAYLKTWNSIPPARPNVLKAFVGKIVKRGGEHAAHEHGRKTRQRRDSARA